MHEAELPSAYGNEEALKMVETDDESLLSAEIRL